MNRLVQRLADGGADLEARTESRSWTPLPHAICETEPVSLRALLLTGAEVDPGCPARGPRLCIKGASTLDEVFALPDLLAVLLGFGAEPNRVDADGQSAMDRLEQQIADNRSLLASIVARGRVPDRNELSAAAGLQSNLDLLRATARRG